MNNILPSWNDGENKSAIIDFVKKVTTKGADFVSEENRIATFDNDGTLWTEYPMQIEIFFTADRIRELAEENPEMKTTQPFKAMLEKDFETLKSLGKKGLMELVIKSHHAESPGDFNKMVSEWFTTAVHPKYKILCKECTYKPQIELLEYLRANGFKTFIVSGGGIDFMRNITQEIYGIPTEQVIGSSVKTKLNADGKNIDIKRIPELNSFDDREVKALNIHLHIGKRPIFVSGNSDGDLKMMQYALSGDKPGMAMLIHHDDAEREAAYDRDFKLSPLSEALDVAKDWGINVVSMKNDWKKIF